MVRNRYTRQERRIRKAHEPKTRDIDPYDEPSSNYGRYLESKRNRGYDSHDREDVYNKKTNSIKIIHKNGSREDHDKRSPYPYSEEDSHHHALYSRRYNEKKDVYYPYNYREDNNISGSSNFLTLLSEGKSQIDNIKNQFIKHHHQYKNFDHNNNVATFDSHDYGILSKNTMFLKDFLSSHSRSMFYPMTVERLSSFSINAHGEDYEEEDTCDYIICHEEYSL